jgi:hypothetical protein
MQHGLKMLNDYAFDTNENTYLNLPDVLNARDPIASQILPWRSYLSKNGLYPKKYWPYYLLEPYLSLCIAGLKDIDKYFEYIV